MKPFRRYVEARLIEYEREKAYRFFVTKSLQLIPQNKFLTQDFSQVLNPEKIDKRTGNEIAADIISRAGLRFDGGEKE